MRLKLAAYKKKRDFKKTPEPSPKIKKSAKKNPLFVVQKHHATHLHYDFRIEMGGVLKSWAVPKGIPPKPAVRHLAILTEDHPMAYAHFHGVIPEGEYGAGLVEIWDHGTFTNLKKDKKTGAEIPLKKSFELGSIELDLHGKTLKGPYALIHFKDKEWLLIKMKKKSSKG